MFLHKRPQIKRGKRIGWIWWVAWTDESGKKQDQSLQKHFRLSFPVTDPWVAKKLLADLEMKEVHDRLGVPDDFGSLSVDEFYREYLRFCDQNRTKETARSHRCKVNAWLRYLKGQGVKSVSQITKKLLNEFVDIYLPPLQKKGIKNATKNRYISLVHASLRWGTEQDHLKENPLQGIIRRTEPHPDRLMNFKRDDLKKLLNIKDKDFVAFLEVMYYTLQRRGDVVGLRWDDLDFKRKKIRIRRPKDQKPKEIEMADKLVPILKSIPRNGDRIFSFSADYATKKFHRLLTELNLKDIRRLHDIRHTGASVLGEEGVDVKTIQELLGHKDSRTTLIYVHSSQRSKRKAINKL